MRFEEFIPFITALAIGLLIGIERERSHPHGAQAFGVRSFALLSLLGAIAAWTNNPYLAALIALFCFTAILLGYFRSTSHQRREADIGFTTELSAGIVFTLGYITFSHTALSIGLATALLAILLSRKRLHTFSRESIRPEELRAAVVILVLLVAVVPFLPDRTIDSWSLFNPHRIGILLVVISLLQFGGYLAGRLFGDNIGPALAGFFGGLVSSTAVFLTISSRSSKKPTHDVGAQVAAGLFATLAMLLELGAILWASGSQELTTRLGPVVGVLALLAGGMGWIEVQSLGRPTSLKSIDRRRTTKNPLDLRSTLKLTALIMILLFLVGFAKSELGGLGVQAIAFLSGLFELHAISLTQLSLFAEGHLNANEASSGLILALGAALVSKLGIVWALDRGPLAKRISVYLIAMIAIGGTLYFLL